MTMFKKIHKYLQSEEYEKEESKKLQRRKKFMERSKKLREIDPELARQIAETAEECEIDDIVFAWHLHHSFKK